MYIRETIKTDKKTSKKYSSYQLVESIRTELGPRQKILLTISSDSELNSLEKTDRINKDVVSNRKTSLQFL
jgi:hypothetical protein